MVRWLGCRYFTAEGPDIIPSQGTKIPQAAQRPNKEMNISFFLNLSLFGISFLASLLTNTQPSRLHLVISQVFFQIFFYVDHFFKFFIEFVTILLLLYVLVFWHQACGILAL